MLFLGVVGAQLNQRLFTPEWVLPGSLVIAFLGVLLAWRKRKYFTQKPPQNSSPLAFDEKLIIG